jgi:hypothetical protein
MPSHDVYAKDICYLSLCACYASVPLTLNPYFELCFRNMKIEVAKGPYFELCFSNIKVEVPNMKISIF